MAQASSKPNVTMASIENRLADAFKRKEGIDWQDIRDEKKLCWLFAYYHYFNANDSKLGDVAAGDVLRIPKYHDDIVGIYRDDDADEQDVDAVVYVDVDSLDPKTAAVDIVTILQNAEREMVLYAKKSYDSRRLAANDPKMADCFANLDIQAFSKDQPLKIVAITRARPQARLRNKIQAAVDGANPKYSNVSYAIYFGGDIEGMIIETESPREYVQEAQIKIDAAGGVCRYGDSAIVNIAASSLKNLFENYRYSGLFAQNLRYYVTMKSVDSNVRKSIAEKSGQFWYLNNDIIVICDDYSIDGGAGGVTLKNFSIVNGGQTTHLIGGSDVGEPGGSPDFFLQCKIIKNPGAGEEARLKFIADVAEASNTQKPIKNKDLVANRPEQRLLKAQLAKANVFCQIKRGEKVNKQLYKEDWQSTTNEELGQLLLSFMYQEPGTARNNKARVTGSKYDLIFGKIKSQTETYNTDLLIDLTRFASLYKEWERNLKKNGCGDKDKLGLVANGLHVMAAILGLLEKYNVDRSLVGVLNSSSATGENRIKPAQRYDLSHRLFNADIFSNKQKLFQLFDLLYSEIIAPAYDYYRSMTPSAVYSNFTKTQKCYATSVLDRFRYYFANNPLVPNGSSPVNVLTATLLYIPTPAEYDANQRLRAGK